MAIWFLRLLLSFGHLISSLQFQQSFPTGIGHLHRYGSWCSGYDLHIFSFILCFRRIQPSCQERRMLQRTATAIFWFVFISLLTTDCSDGRGCLFICLICADLWNFSLCQEQLRVFSVAYGEKSFKSFQIFQIL